MLTLPETIFLYTTVFFFGAAWGSFFNVCIHRMPRDLSVVRPPSACPVCKKFIKFYDNIPLVSYILLRGKCRNCHTKISPRYFLVELLTAVIFIGEMHVFIGESYIKAISAIIFTSLLLVASFIDLEHYIIPDEISLGGFAVGLILSAVFPSLMGTTSHLKGFLYSFGAALACGGLLLLIALIAEFVLKKEAMGMGDVKLLFLIGSFLGIKTGLLSILLASFVGSVFGIAMIVKKDAAWQSKIPFGPYLAIGALISLFFGEKMIQSYLLLLMYP